MFLSSLPSLPYFSFIAFFCFWNGQTDGRTSGHDPTIRKGIEQTIRFERKGSSRRSPSTSNNTLSSQLSDRSSQVKSNQARPISNIFCPTNVQRSSPSISPSGPSLFSFALTVVHVHVRISDHMYALPPSCFLLLFRKTPSSEFE